MSTELLLTTDIDKLGLAGDIVKVADGYARNFLVPQGLAEPVTESAKRRIAKINGVLAEYGISVTSAGENIAYGFDTARSACDAFMNSAPHRSSILDANKTYMGMGAYRASDGTTYWAQLFASGSGMSGKQV